MFEGEAEDRVVAGSNPALGTTTREFDREILRMASPIGARAGFDFLIQSNVLKGFLTESNVNNAKGPVDEAFIRGLTYYFHRHYSAAKKEFETVAGLFECHWRAKNLIAECNSAIAHGQNVPLGWTMDSSTLTIIITVCAVVAVSAAVVVLVRRRKAPELPPPPPRN